MYNKNILKTKEIYFIKYIGQTKTTRRRTYTGAGAERKQSPMTTPFITLCMFSHPARSLFSHIILRVRDNLM